MLIKLKSSEWCEDKKDIADDSDDRREGDGIIRGGDKDTADGGAGEGIAGGDITLDAPESGVSGIGEDPPTDISFTLNGGGAGGRTTGAGGSGWGLLRKSDKSLSSSSMRFM